MNSCLIFFIVFLLFSISCSYVPIEIKEKKDLIDALEKNINGLQDTKIFKINTCGKDIGKSFKLFFYSYQRVHIFKLILLKLYKATYALMVRTHRCYLKWYEILSNKFRSTSLEFPCDTS